MSTDYHINYQLLSTILWPSPVRRSRPGSCFWLCNLGMSYLMYLFYYVMSYGMSFFSKSSAPGTRKNPYFFVIPITFLNVTWYPYNFSGHEFFSYCRYSFYFHLKIAFTWALNFLENFSEPFFGTIFTSLSYYDNKFITLDSAESSRSKLNFINPSIYSKCLKISRRIARISMSIGEPRKAITMSRSNTFAWARNLLTSILSLTVMAQLQFHLFLLNFNLLT